MLGIFKDNRKYCRIKAMKCMKATLQYAGEKSLEDGHS